MWFVNIKYIETNITFKVFSRKSLKKDTSQHQAAFFHKFGLVRLSLNPGMLIPGFFFVLTQNIFIVKMLITCTYK